MDEIFKKLNNEAKKISLNKEEKSSVRNILISYSKKSPYYGEKTSYGRLFNFVFVSNKRVLISAFVILLLILGGGTSYAAENSLPGDFLYTIKVHVNENVEGFLALNPKARAKLNEKIIEKRLEEVDKLASLGKLNEKNKIKIEEGIEKASVKLNRHLEKLMDERDFEKVSEINDSLEVSYGEHGKKLEKLIEKEDSSKEEIKSILNKINEKSDNLKKNKIRFELKNEDRKYHEKIDIEEKIQKEEEGRVI
ncbi:MAG: DUF5667 domain-containing protein [Minisyncoccia bacterium]